jgi:retinol dehydrogenase-13
MSKRVALITGATGAIGKAIARQIAEDHDFAVVLACRDEGRGRRAADEIRRVTGKPKVRCEVVDLARAASVDALAKRWQGPLHVLVNNAAIAPRQREETPEGLELQFATNVMGYFWLTHALGDLLAQGAPARVVMVASYWAGGLDLEDLQFTRRRYDNDAAYRQSKQADRMLAAAFARRLRDRGVVVNACHPGDVNSTLSNSLGFGGHETPDEGARTPVLLATGAEAGEVTGKYFEHGRERPCRFAADPAAVEALYQQCLAHAGRGA